MNPLSIALAALLASAPVATGERPVWSGSLQPRLEGIVVSAVPGGLRVRSASSVLTPAGDSSAVLGAGLCPGADPRLGVPSATTLYLLGPGAPATLVATVTLPSQAVSAAVPVTTSSGCRLAVALQSG
ncbi:MAG: hypothetical protein WCK73_09075, partial [Deltaproteobacteria bacterium]